MTRLPAPPLLASSKAAVPPVCSANAELLAIPDDAGVEPLCVDEPVALLVPAAAEPAAEFEELLEELAALAGGAVGANVSLAAAETDIGRVGAADDDRRGLVLGGQNQLAVAVETSGDVGMAEDVGVDGVDQIADRVGPGRCIGRRIGAVVDGDLAFCQDPEREQRSAGQTGAVPVPVAGASGTGDVLEKWTCWKPTNCWSMCSTTRSNCSWCPAARSGLRPSAAC